MLIKSLTLQHLPRPHHHLSVAQPTLLPHHRLHRVAERPVGFSGDARVHVRRRLVRLAPAQQDPLVGSYRPQQSMRRRLKPQTRVGAKEFLHVSADVRGGRF